MYSFVIKFWVLKLFNFFKMFFCFFYYLLKYFSKFIDIKGTVFNFFFVVNIFLILFVYI